MNQRILFVDDDPHILQAFQRTLRKRFDLDVAVGPEEGLRKVMKNGPFAVVVSDMRMPNMNGVEYLREVRKISPDTVRMILTGNADQQSAIDAVNEGYIFRFLTKPCPAEVLVKALEAGLEQHRLITAEKELLTSTLAGCIRVLTEILSLVAPEAFGRAVRVRDLVSRLCRELNVADAWQVEIATMLAPIGCIAMPEEIVTRAIRGEPLKDTEQATFQTHPRIAHDLISKIPRLEQVARIVAYQDKLYDGSGFPADLIQGEEIPLGSRIIKLAYDWDSLISTGLSPELALAEITDRHGWYDPKVVNALRKTLNVQQMCIVREMKISDLVDGLILADNVYSVNGTLLCSKGQEITPAIRFRLRNYAVNVGIARPVRVFVPILGTPDELSPDEAYRPT
ncbi:MAG: HD domain-containing phosphohydrolase [Thermogutta sp.]